MGLVTFYVLNAELTPEGERIPDMSDTSCGTEQNPFQAVLVFTDPVDWYRDLQLITDVIMSGQHIWGDTTVLIPLC